MNIFSGVSVTRVLLFSHVSSNQENSTVSTIKKLGLRKGNCTLKRRFTWPRKITIFPSNYQVKLIELLIDFLKNPFS